MGVDAAIDITTEERQTVLGLLQRHLPGTAAWVYGSRVKWTSRRQSDLDLVVFATPEQRPHVGDLREAFEESNLSFRVDLFVWDDVPESFRARITANHVVMAKAHAAERREWRGEGENWDECALGELTDNFDSIRVPVKRADRSPGPYPYYGASEVVDQVADYLFDGEYLLVAEDGENLRTRNTPIAFLANGKFWANNHAHVIRANRKADTRFLMYALSQLNISGYVTGSTIPKLTQDNMNRIRVWIPAVREQRAIAHILGTLDDKIELNRRMNATLKAMARALFRSWFVDFDPVRAKMEGRDTGLPKDIADLFPDRLVDSELGHIPQGWRMWRLEELANHHAQFITPSSDPEAEFDLFSLPAHDTGQLPARVTGMAIGSNKALVPPNAVLVSKLNPKILRVWMPEKSSGSLQVCSTEFIVFTPRSPATRSLLFSLFSDANFREMLQSMVTGTSGSHQRVPANGLKQRQVLPGTRALLRSFGEIVTPILAHTVEARAESRSLAALRDALLPKLVSGELRVNTLEPIARDDSPSIGSSR